VAVGLLALAALAVPTWLHVQRLGQRQQLRIELEALKSERAQLAVALDQLKQEHADQPPLLYLGGNDGVDYVVDLRQLEPRPRPEPTRAMGDSP
jgi:hypothetical protein